MAPHLFNFDIVHPSWQSCIKDALTKMDPRYLQHLYHDNHWLPNHRNIFSAFSIPKNKVHYVLFGESPYPRMQSANGYAFWDEAVTDIWSATGLSKAVNRATSLRNIIKMLLVGEKVLDPQKTGQEAIAAIDKTNFIQTNHELFTNFLHHGFLLLNASLVLQSTPVQKDALAWQPFIKHILAYLCQQNPTIHFILLGNIANALDKLIPDAHVKKLYAEHPYNISFINNPNVLDFFNKLHLLRKKT